VGAHTKLGFRYFLTGATACTVQIFDATVQDNRHVRLTDLKQGEWTTLYLDFSKDSRRNDGTANSPFAAGNLVDDLFFFLEGGSGNPTLFVDEVVLFDAAAAVPPYPPSPVIKETVWASTNTLIRKALDGDNWPVTWASDGALYTTWGVGTGFEPKVEKKLSCGFARVMGMPPDFAGENVRSPAEQLGQGRDGLKGWGILGVEDVLYLWFGHADKKGGQSRLAWSRDRARTWTFADWTFAEFGLLGFVNYGRGYDGARDEFVYAYSHDGPQADTPADRFILLRAPKEQLAQRAAWEFFAGIEPSGLPAWSRDINQRRAVFENRDGCLRSAITYNAGLRRYLWWQQIPQPPGHPDRGDTRFNGGFAIYDAPEPWGPWTTAYFAAKWDVGPGEHGDFPAKWMSENGRNAWLVFSGDDAFSVRQAQFTVADEERSKSP
jgi:hypothetical protein